MLGKLLMYDLKVSMKYYTTIVAVLVCTIILAILCALTKISILNNIVIGIAYMLSIGCVGGYILICFVRFYTQMCGNESYLTYMIPASIGKTVFSKILTAFIWGIAVIAILVVFWTVLVGVVFPHVNLGTQISTIWESLKPYASLAITMLIFLLFMSNLLIALSCAVSCLPSVKNRNGGLATLIISFIVLYQLFGLVMVVVWIVTLLFSGGSLTSEFFGNQSNFPLIVNSLRNAMLGCTVVYSVLIYVVSVFLFRKHRSI